MTTEPASPTIRFLTRAEALVLHDVQIERFGGRPGVRDLGLLDSALAAPAAGIAGTYFHADLFEMAAAYLFHLAQYHPFIDGNKRVAAHAAQVFLDVNGLELIAGDDEYYDITLAVADGRADKATVAAFFRQSTRPL